jgi:ABC-type branched-subunit amino acid transport system substrate-binding protein
MSPGSPATTGTICVHRQRYAEIRDDVLALAQTFGSATTAAILDDLVADDMVAAPTTWTSQWLFTDVIVESGNTMCVEAMNAVDYTVFRGDEVETVMAIHLADDDGEDAAVGARIAAERNGMRFVDVETRPGAGNQADAVSEVVAQDPDLVVIATTPTETAAIVGRAAAADFDGIMIATGPGWDDALLDGPDADAVRSLLLGARPWRAFSHGTVGHGALREALGDVEPDDAYTSGWIWSYPLRDALRAAVAAGDLTRQGLLEAVTSLDAVDYEFMLPPGSGAFGADSPVGEAVLRTVFRMPEPGSVTGGTSEEDFFNGVTAGTYAFERPFYEDW